MASASPQVSLSERELDALRELANIGCGHAAYALSRLVGGRKVAISVPRSELLPVAEVSGLVGGQSQQIAAVLLDVTGTVTGQLWLVMSEEDARSLAGMLLGRKPEAGPLGEGARSALCETGNIVGSACLSAIGGAFGLRLIPSVPTLTIEAAEKAFAGVLRPLPGDKALVLETRFSMEDRGDMSGHFLLLPELPTLPKLLAAMGVHPTA
jgi:chemotaxis protein CheC